MISTYPDDLPFSLLDRLIRSNGHSAKPIGSRMFMPWFGREFGSLDILEQVCRESFLNNGIMPHLTPLRIIRC